MRKKETETDASLRDPSVSCSLCGTRQAAIEEGKRKKKERTTTNGDDFSLFVKEEPRGTNVNRGWGSPFPTENCDGQRPTLRLDQFEHTKLEKKKEQLDNKK